MAKGTHVYDELGITPVITTLGAVTLVGSRLSPRVVEARNQANERYASMADVLDRCADRIVELLGVEAAFITTGVSGGLMLATSAVMTGTDPDQLSRLPDTTGMRNEILVQGPAVSEYLRPFTVTGARIVRAGTEESCSAEELEGAIGPATAAIGVVGLNFALDPERSVSLERIVEIGRRNGIPVIVDAAGQTTPASHHRAIAQSADLVCFGGKYVNGPGDTGYVVGRTDLIEAVKAHGFVAYDELGTATWTGAYGGVGRALKVDRSDAVATVVALQDWLEMDHQVWKRQLRGQLQTIHDAISDLPLELSWEGDAEDPQAKGGIWLYFTLDEDRLGVTAKHVAATLAAENPAVWVGWWDGEPRKMWTGAGGPDVLRLGEEQVVARRLRDVLTSGMPRP